MRAWVWVLLLAAPAASHDSTTAPPIPDELDNAGWDALKCCNVDSDCQPNEGESGKASRCTDDGMCAPQCKPPDAGDPDPCAALATWLGGGADLECKMFDAPTTTTAATTTTTAGAALAASATTTNSQEVE